MVLYAYLNQLIHTHTSPGIHFIEVLTFAKNKNKEEWMTGRVCVLTSSLCSHMNSSSVPLRGIIGKLSYYIPPQKAML